MARQMRDAPTQHQREAEGGQKQQPIGPDRSDSQHEIARGKDGEQEPRKREDRKILSSSYQCPCADCRGNPCQQ